MFNNKIATRLVLNFSAALVTFAMIIGGIFTILFKNYTLDVHKTEMLNSGRKIAQTFSEYMPDNEMMMGGYGAYLRLIGDLADSDIWIVDRDLNLSMSERCQGRRHECYQYKDLPEHAGKIIEAVFQDKEVFSEEFSSLMSELTLTLGVPIKGSNNEVMGVVLLHSPVYGMQDGILQGFKLLGISILLALGVALIVAIGLSYSFTKPLGIMKQTAIRLVNGDYTAKNHMKQKDEIGELANTIDELAERLEEASLQSDKLEELRREFVANISHELRTPITVIRGSLEALVDHVVTEPGKVEEYYRQMLDEASFLQRLVGDLLDLSKLQNMDFKIEKQLLCLEDVIRDVARSAKQLARQKEVEVQVVIADTDCRVEGDYGRLRQMVMIILDNAIKFSNVNGVVQILLKDRVLTIRDQGKGIREEDVVYIFDRFYKTRSEENKTGTGLGLAIAKQIADRHEILVEVNSKVGAGSEFSFKF